MADSFITSSIVLAEALSIFKNNLRMGNAVHRDYASEFKGTPKVGESFQIPNPWRSEVQDGPTINLADTTETSITVSITAHKTVPIKIAVRDKTMKVNEFKKKYLRDAMIKLANQVDMDLLNEYKNVGQAVGTAGTTPNAWSIFGDASAKLDFMSCPPGEDSRNFVLDPLATWKMADTIKALYTVPDPMQKKLLEDGLITKLAGMGGLYSSQNVKAHTAGTADANYLVNGASQTGTSLIVDTGTGTLVAGDIITIVGVNALNPVSYQSTGQLQQFVATAAYAGGAGTVSISPGIVITGPTRNVSGSPADNAAITLVASHKANLAFHSDAFCLATVPFELPETAPVKEQLKADGIIMTLTGGWDVTNFREIYRLDILYAIKTLRPEWAVRIMG